VLGGIACGSPLHLAGIRSGDVVHDVNGHRVSSIPGALKAYGKLKKARVLEVNITRRGRPLLVTYYVT
jgi:S1-C subfamily serine protease